MPKRSLKLKFGVRQLLMATAALFAGLVVWSARATDDSLAPSTGAVKAPDLTVHYSAGLYEILKMADAKVDPEVIKAYIKNSPIAYDPSAAEIIALKEHGLPADGLT